MSGGGKRSKISIALFEIVRSNLDAVHVGYLEVDKLIDLYPRLKRQHELISAARELLRAFIEANFSVVDVLYVKRG